jgi:predicted nicotinamide N-methyase
MTHGTECRCEAFVRSHTIVQRPPLVPEIELHLAAEPFAIFQAAEESGAARPYWAFAWPGGQALARYLLDHPELVAGRRVLDIGSGSGLATIAAAMAGATSAIANDTDPLAGHSARLNAIANGVVVTVDREDRLAAAPDVDLILIGEVFYEPEMAQRITAFLEQACRHGATLFFADRAGVRRPPVDLALVLEEHAPLTPGLGIAGMDVARVWRLMPTSRSVGRARRRGTRP